MHETAACPGNNQRQRSMAVHSVVFCSWQPFVLDENCQASSTRSPFESGTTWYRYRELARPRIEYLQAVSRRRHAAVSTSFRRVSVLLLFFSSFLKAVRNGTTDAIRLIAHNTMAAPAAPGAHRPPLDF